MPGKGLSVNGEAKMSNERVRDVDLDTPALLLDAALLERNIARMAAFARQAGIHLRPHAKTHKSPQIAAMQIAAGAIGITCQKLGEAEVMADAGIDGILISNQIVGRHKIARLVNLARRTDVAVAVDDPRNVDDLSAAAVSAGVPLKVVVEVDVGMGRCGVQPGEPALQLAQLVRRSPGLAFVGLMGYEGHAVSIHDAEQRRQTASAALQLLVDTVELLQSRGLPVPVVSSTGTGTYDVGGRFPGITEIQVGSYATMDGAYREVGVPFDCALTILTTIISTPRDGVAIADAGMKSIATDHGLPKVLDIPDAEVVSLSEEHGRIALCGPTQPRPGDKIRLLPMHGCTTINLHDRFYVVRDGYLEAVWPVVARGRSQ
jgi:D-serine deaminase-like pyridoxal phosphate-dependent protein